MKLLFSAVGLLALVQVTYALPARVLNQILPFKEVVAFGDSITDDSTHGSWALTNGTWPEDPAYFKEGARRFSNGHVWIEDVASSINVPLRSFAVGGATSDNDLVAGFTGKNSDVPSPSIMDQIEEYIRGQKNAPTSRKTLFVICIGANDIFFDPKVNADQVAEKVSVAVDKLRSIGGHAFLLVAPPNIGSTPGTVGSTQELLDRYASYTNGLKKELHRLRVKLSKPALKLNVGFVDMGSVIKAIANSPKRYGYSKDVLYEGCLKGAYPFEKTERSLCKHPEKRIFFDAFHPSKKTHRLIANKAIEEIRHAFRKEGVNVV